MRAALILFVISVVFFIAHYLMPFQNGADGIATMFGGAALAVWAVKYYV